MNVSREVETGQQREPNERRASALFVESFEEIARHTDRLFSVLIFGEWLAGIVVDASTTMAPIDTDPSGRCP